MSDLSDGNYVICWNCKRKVRVGAIRDCDGFCPNCDCEIDLDIVNEYQTITTHKDNNMKYREDFDASCNDEPSIRVTNEAVSEFDIRQLSADEVIYVTDTKADVPMPICWRIGDECVINQDRYIIRNIKEVYTVDQIGNKWSFDANYREMARPEERNARQVAIAEALEVFTGMISPSETQLGVLYDAGYLLPKKV